jgi:transcriptional regulator with XRE-family HTH domain
MTAARESSITKIREFGGPGALPAIAIGQVLREARRRRGLTQRQLGAPFSAAFVSSVENGKTIPSLASLAILTGRLGMSLGEFFGEVERRPGAFAPLRSPTSA